MALIYFIPALRIILGLLYIVTSALKFPNLKGFADIVAQYDVLPKKLVKPAAYTQPIIEFFVGWWVLSGKYLIHAAYAGLALMIIANIFVITAYAKKKKLDNCGCYGAFVKTPLTRKKIAENLFWTALFIMLLLGAYQAQPFT